MSMPAGAVWPSLRAAAHAFCPPLEVVDEDPGRLAIGLRDDVGDAVYLSYRSERGLFLRTYYLVLEADLPGSGPTDAGELVLGRRWTRWRKPRPRDAGKWSETFRSPEIRAAVKRVPTERLSLRWRPDEASWRLVLETLLGSVTATFFPALMTPNPLRREEAQAMIDLVGTLRRTRA